MIKKFKFIFQKDRMDCGPICLQMISLYYGKKYNINFIRSMCNYNKQGVTINSLKAASEQLGFEAHPISCTKEQLIDINIFPSILHWNNDHYVVLLGKSNNYYLIADPGFGKIKIKENLFLQNWYKNKSKGVALILKPQELIDSNDNESKPYFFLNLKKYYKKYKKSFILIFIYLSIVNLLTFSLPFITQKIFDDGIAKSNYQIVYYLALSQFVIFIGIYFTEFIRNFLSVSIGGKIGIEIIHNFFSKLLKLPIPFLETKVVGDYNQRIQDSQRIESFMTSQGLFSIFSVITILVYLTVLFIYNFFLFIIYIFLTIISLYVTFLFFNKRKIYDYQSFKEKANIQSQTFEILNGINEVKLNSLEEQKLKVWVESQMKIFNINMKSSKLEQTQQILYNSINQIKNLSISMISSIFVIENYFTIGELLTISFISGQLNSPVNQLISFFKNLQDSKLSMDRISEIELQEEEDNKDMVNLNDIDGMNSIEFKNVNFSYNKRDFILKNINIRIPENKVTAIVGTSGSGKTTLIKLILKFYSDYSGSIFIKEENILNISSTSIRENIGVVMQDGYLFSDTIENNITGNKYNTSVLKKEEAYTISNAIDFIQRLPLKDKTKVGGYGMNLSGGQEQRIMIARAIYKNPKFLILDEATSSLDTKNEKIIHNNLKNFFKNRTVIIIAHRLSTVKNADNIIVMDDGRVVEQGIHNDLVTKKGYYYDLIKNQLEINKS